MISAAQWGCFDEFNRSPWRYRFVAGEIHPGGPKNKLTEFLFEGKEMKLVATTGNFITMNPGYAGRSET